MSVGVVGSSRGVVGSSRGEVGATRGPLPAPGHGRGGRGVAREALRLDVIRPSWRTLNRRATRAARTLPPARFYSEDNALDALGVEGLQIAVATAEALAVDTAWPMRVVKSAARPMMPNEAEAGDVSEVRRSSRSTPSTSPHLPFLASRCGLRENTRIFPLPVVAERSRRCVPWPLAMNFGSGGLIFSPGS